MDYWGEIADRHGLDLTVVNPLVDPTWRFMTLDWDGKIRMDCSSPSAMASLIARKDEYDIATGNDADSDRHGIVTPDGGLMNPNHYLAVAIGYLYGGARPRLAGRRRDRQDPGVVLDDRPGRGPVGRTLTEVPVGFKWFVPGLLDGSIALRRRGVGRGVVPALRRLGVDHRQGRHHPRAAGLGDPRGRPAGRPREHYAELTAEFGDPAYARVDAPANRDEKAKLAALSPDDVTASTLAGEEITAKLTEAPGNGAKIGGLKVTTESAWFAARPSGTEDVYKIYAESFQGADHLAQVQEEAREVVGAALGG